MRVCQLPALRRSALHAALFDLERSGELTAVTAWEAFETHIEAPATRVGVFCDVDGCRRVLEDRSINIGHNSVVHESHCADHGERRGVFALAVAFAPVEPTRPGGEPVS